MERREIEKKRKIGKEKGVKIEKKRGKLEKRKA